MVLYEILYSNILLSGLQVTSVRGTAKQQRNHHAVPKSAMMSRDQRYRDAIQSLATVFQTVESHRSTRFDTNEVGVDARELDSSFGDVWRSLRDEARTQLGEFEEVDDQLDSTVGPSCVGFITNYPNDDPLVRLNLKLYRTGRWKISSFHHPPGTGPQSFREYDGKKPSFDIEQIVPSSTE